MGYGGWGAAHMYSRRRVGGCALMSAFHHIAEARKGREEAERRPRSGLSALTGLIRYSVGGPPGVREGSLPVLYREFNGKCVYMEIIAYIYLNLCPKHPLSLPL